MQGPSKTVRYIYPEEADSRKALPVPTQDGEMPSVMVLSLWGSASALFSANTLIPQLLPLSCVLFSGM